MLVEIVLVIAATAIIHLILGYSWGKKDASPLSEQDKETAFQEAKAEYLDYFQRRFTGTGEKLAEAYNASLMKENTELRKQVGILKEELIKERKQNESTGSN